MKPLIFVYYFIFLISCGESGNSNSVSSVKEQINDSTLLKTRTASEDSTRFYPLKHNLYINKKGEIAYRAFDQTVPGDIREDFLLHVNNFDTINGDQKEIRYVVDTATFEFLSDQYYRDKRYSYYHFPMMDGGFFSIIWEADLNTLKVLRKSWYAKDKRHIFCRGSILEKADYKTFTVIPFVSKGDTIDWLGKDKNNVYRSHEQLDKQTIKDWNIK